MSLTTEKTDLDSLVLQVGEVQINPTQYTIQDRLKTISGNTSQTNNNFTTTNSTNINLSKDDLDGLCLQIGDKIASPTQYSTNDRLKTINTSLISLLRSVTPQGYAVITLDANPKKIVSANVLRKNVIIQAGATNGVSYLGYDVNVTNINYVVRLNAGDIYSNDSYLGDFYISDTIATDTISYGEV
jgi:hypothetical protein